MRTFLLISLFIATVSALILAYTESTRSALIAGPNGTEIAVVPTKQDIYAKRDIQLQLTLPSAFFHQRGENWKGPLNSINFSLDTRGNKATKLSPIENSNVVVVILQITAFDAVDARYNKSNPRYIGGLEEVLDRGYESRFGLNYMKNQIYPGSVPEEYLFDDESFHRTGIHCRPSGNSYPSLCTLTHMNDRGGGIIPKSRFAVMTEIIFRHDRLPEWQAIRDHVHNFLIDKITVKEWSN